MNAAFLNAMTASTIELAKLDSQILKTAPAATAIQEAKAVRRAFDAVLKAHIEQIETGSADYTAALRSEFEYAQITLYHQTFDREP